MFHSRKLNNRINQIRERALRLIYKDDSSTFDALLFKVSTKLQKLAVQIFEIKLGLAPEVMKNVFPIIENPYNIKKTTKFSQEMSKLIEMALKMLLLLYQEFLYFGLWGYGVFCVIGFLYFVRCNF